MDALRAHEEALLLVSSTACLPEGFHISGTERTLIVGAGQGDSADCSKPGNMTYTSSR